MNKLVKRIYKYISHCARKKEKQQKAYSSEDRYSSDFKYCTSYYIAFRKHTVTLRKFLNKIDKEKLQHSQKK